MSISQNRHDHAGINPARGRRFPIDIAFILALIIAVRIYIPSWLFADFSSYLYLVDQLTFNPSTSWLSSEPLSWAPILAFRYFTGSTFQAVVVGHWYLSLVFLGSALALQRRYDLPWQFSVLLFGVFGPLLAFVTLRATPAYFAVAFAVMEAGRGRRRSFIILLVACLFHLSSLMMVLPVSIAFLQNRSEKLNALLRSPLFVGVLAAMIILPFVVFTDLMNLYLGEIISIFGSTLGKFTTYIKNDAATDMTGASGGSFHQVYFILVSVILIGWIFVSQEIGVRIRGFVFTGYGIFLFLQFSPVSAYRESIFWMIPLLMTFPWKKIALSGFGSAAILAAAAIMFAYGIGTVLV